MSDHTPPTDAELADHFQTVTIVLSDGTRAEFTGRAQIRTDNPPRVLDVIVSVPQKLPPSLSWDRWPNESGVT